MTLQRSSIYKVCLAVSFTKALHFQKSVGVEKTFPKLCCEKETKVFTFHFHSFHNINGAFLRQPRGLGINITGKEVNAFSLFIKLKSRLWKGLFQSHCIENMQSIEVVCFSDIFAAVFSCILDVPQVCFIFCFSVSSVRNTRKGPIAKAKQTTPTLLTSSQRR